MAKGFSRTVFPLSVLCIAFGLYTTDFRQTKIRRPVKVYCCLISILLFACESAETLWDFIHIEFNFIVVTHRLMEVVVIITLAYYRVKCMTGGQKETRDICDSMGCADKYLAYIGVTVPNKRHSLLCLTIYSVTIAISFVVWIWLIMRCV